MPGTGTVLIKLGQILVVSPALSASSPSYSHRSPRFRVRLLSTLKSSCTKALAAGIRYPWMAPPTVAVEIEVPELEMLLVEVPLVVPANWLAGRRHSPVWSGSRSCQFLAHNLAGQVGSPGTSGS